MSDEKIKPYCINFYRHTIESSCKICATLLSYLQPRPNIGIRIDREYSIACTSISLLFIYSRPMCCVLNAGESNRL